MVSTALSRRRGVCYTGSKRTAGLSRPNLTQGTGLLSPASAGARSTAVLRREERGVGGGWFLAGGPPSRPVRGLTWHAPATLPQVLRRQTWWVSAAGSGQSMHGTTQAISSGSGDPLRALFPSASAFPPFFSPSLSLVSRGEHGMGAPDPVQRQPALGAAHARSSWRSRAVAGFRRSADRDGRRRPLLRRHLPCCLACPSPSLLLCPPRVARALCTLRKTLYFRVFFNPPRVLGGVLLLRTRARSRPRWPF